MLLPDQMGVYESPESVGLGANTPEDTAEVAKLIPLLHIQNGNNSQAINLVNNGSVKTKRAIWFVRNSLLDDIKFYYRTLTDSNLSELKTAYKLLAKQSYDALKSGTFRSVLARNELTLPREIEEGVEETYKAALKLDKQI